MTKFNPGDVVRIIKQAEPYVPKWLDSNVGFIKSISSNRAYFIGLTLKGHPSCGLRVPLDCLKLETDPSWMHAKTLYDSQFKQNVDDCVAKGDRIAARMSELSAEYGLPVERIKALIADVEHLKGLDWWPDVNIGF